jgi:hypothetical protein
MFGSVTVCVFVPTMVIVLCAIGAAAICFPVYFLVDSLYEHFFIAHATAKVD